METKRLTIPAAEELLDRYFPVLDHGFIALKDYMGGDEGVDEAARTSYGAGTRKVNERRGLIRTLRRNMHTSPSEMCELKFHCSMPIFVARQWIRHRTASVNEYSARYSVMPMLFYVPDQSVVGTQSINNKQGRGSALNLEQFEAYLESVEAVYEAARIAYENQVAMGVARETARGVLPVTTYTQWYWKIDLHNLLHFLTLRCGPHAQLEIRVFADVMAGMVKRIAPLSFEAWLDYTFAGARMSRMEMEVLRSLLVMREDPEEGRWLEGRKGFIGENRLIDTYGFSKTEVGELAEKLRPRDVPSFKLDLSLAKDGEFFARQWEAAVPKVDRVG